MTIEKNICDAIDIIVQQAISSASYDKTIKAVISDCVDSSTGQYTVKYQDAIFYAYSQNTNITYTSGTSVWVLVPRNDMSQTKTILGTVTKLGTDYVTVVEEEDNYEINGTNCISSSTIEYGLKSYLPDSATTEFLVTGTNLAVTATASLEEIEGTLDSDYVCTINNSSIEASSSGDTLTLVVSENSNLNIITLYSRDAGINLIGLDTDAVEQYLKSSDYLYCALNARTELPLEQQTQGNYGIIYALDFLDTSTGNIVTKYYTINVDNMTGNPYKFIAAAYQYGIFAIDSENFIDINYISLFCYNFPYSKDESECIEDIFLSNFELYGANFIEEDDNGYSLTIKTPSGRYFAKSALDSDTRTLEADFRVNGTSVTSDLTYYWFIENSSISTKSIYYNKYGGQGWKCLNDYEVLSSSDDGTTDVIEWLNGNNTYTVTKKNLYTTNTTYKLVVIYAGAAISKTIDIINLDAEYTLSIKSDLGIQFYYNQGYPTLQCLVNDEENNDLTYVWSVVDINGSYSSLSETTTDNVIYNELLVEYNELLANIESGQVLKSANQEALESLESQLSAYETVMRIEGNTIYHLNVNTITTSSTYKCSVYAGELYIGTSSIVLYNTLETEGTYNLILNNSSYTYKYDESGVSPASNSLSFPIAIPELSFTLYDNLGNELSEDVIKKCEIQWLVPNEDTMIEISSDYTPAASANGYNYYTGLTTLVYTIAETYDNSKVNNDIKLIVGYQDLVLTATTNLTFIKEGESGTNGTEFICKIVPNNSSFSDYPLVTEYSNGSYEWNYAPVTENVYFKIQLYHNEVLIFDGAASGTSEEGKTVNIAWSILGNKYSGTRSDKSDFSITGLDGIVTFNGYTGSIQGLSSTQSYPVNIIKATVKYDDVTYYVTLPILTAFVSDNDYTISLTKNTGFLYSIYTTDGQSPQYSSAKPFEIPVTQEIDGYIEDVSELTNDYRIYYNWNYLGSIYNSTNDSFIEEIHLSQNNSYNEELANNQMAIKPDDSFDGECLSNAIEVVVINNAGTEVARIHIPVHMYLNRYGQAALNSWDGNSISISEDGGYILAPQVGAGYKEDDNSFTGVLMGKVKESGSDETETGLFGYYQGVRTIFLDATTGSALFGATGKGQIIIDPTNDIAQIYSGNYSTENGTGLLIDLTTPEIRYGSGNFTVNADGYVHMTGATVEGYSTTEDMEEVRDASIVDVAVYYAESTSSTVTPTSGWSLTQPTARAGYYIWVQTIVTYGNGTQEETYMLLTGNEGVGISSITEYYLTTTDTTMPDIDSSEWVTSIDKLKYEFDTTYKYLWNYEKVNYTDGNVQNTEPVIISVYATDGENGRGIVSITNYYVTSNSATVAPTTGWSINPSDAIISSTNKYLWNYEAIIYTDSDEPVNTTPAVIGAYGDTGADGVTFYTWVKFASDEIGSDITDDPEGMSYIGLSYNNASSLESDDPNDYQWTLFKGSDGVDGDPGVDGTNAYTWIKFADDANGTNMSDDPTGKYYIGFAYNKDNAEESDDPNDYQWALFRGSNGVDGTGINIKGSAYAKIAASISASDSTISIVSTTDAIISDVTNAYGYTHTLAILSNNSLIDSLEDSETLAIDTTDYVIGDSNYILYYDEEFTEQITSPEESDSYLVNGYLFVWSGTDDYFTCVGRIQGVGIESVIEYYAVSASSTVSPESWVTDPSKVTLSATNKYLWNYEAIVYTDNSISTTSPVVIGNFAEDGEDGATINTIVEYYGVSSSVATQPTSWTTDASSSTALMTATNKYLWNYEVITYTDNRSTTFDAVIIGVYGDEGNGIENIIAYYIASSSATTAPTFSASTLSNWSTDMNDVSVSDSQYLWMAYLFTYTNGGTIYSAPACLTDNATRKQVTTLTEYYNTITTDITGIKGDITTIQTTVDNNYTTVTKQITDLVLTSSEFSTTLSNLTETTVAGGRNYCLLSGDYVIDGDTGWHHLNPPSSADSGSDYLTVTSYEGYTRLYAVARTSGHYASISLSEPLEAGEIYTVTINLRMSVKKIFALYAIASASSAIYDIGNINSADYDANTYFTTTLTFVAPDNASSFDYDEIGFDIYEAYAANGGTIDVQWIKLEKGSIATEWTCAPEDISVAAIQSIVSQTASSWSVQLQQVEESLGNYATKAELALVLNASTGEATLNASATYITLFATNELRITSGNFTIDSSGNVTMQGQVTATSGYIGDGTNGFTITSTAIYNGKKSLTASSTGVYIGTDGISLGTGSTFKVTTDGALTATSATITGSITATSGYIGSSSSNGFTIAFNSSTSKYCIYSGSKSTFTSTNSGIYIGPDGISLGSYSSTYSSSPFQVTSSGVLTVRSGTVGGWTLSSTQIYKQSTTSAAYQLVLNAPSSPSATTKAMYIQTGTYSDSTYSWGDYLFYVRYDGYLYATKAVITGTLTASSGSVIGPWTVTDTSIYYGSSSFGNSSGMYFGTNGLSLGSAFKVTAAGALTATGADITGKITATSGYIGSTSSNGFTIGLNGDSTYYAFYSNNKNSFASTASGVYIGRDGIALGAFNSTYGSSTFQVNSSGTLSARNAVISGTITAGANSVIGGWTLTSTTIYKASTTSTAYQVVLNAPSSPSASTKAMYIQTGTYATDGTYSWSSSYPFYVRYDGYLYATSGTFSGTITAASGSSFGGWTIADTAIYRTSSTWGASSGMYFGSRGLSVGSTFTVSSAGHLICTSATIGGYTVGADSIYSDAVKLTNDGIEIASDGTVENSGTIASTGTIRTKIADDDDTYISMIGDSLYFFGPSGNTDGGIAGVIKPITYYDLDLYDTLGQYSLETAQSYYGMYIGTNLSEGFIAVGSKATGSDKYNTYYCLDASGRSHFYSNLYVSNTTAAGQLIISGISSCYLKMCTYDNFAEDETTYASVAYLNNSGLNIGDFACALSLQGSSFAVFGPSLVNIIKGGTDTGVVVGNKKMLTQIYGTNIYLTSSDAIHASTSITVDSDARLKTDFDSASAYSGVFDGLAPLTYRYKNNPDKIHFGFTTQGTQAAFMDNGFDYEDYAILGTAEDEDGNVYGTLAYSEIIALLVYEVQEAKKNILSLKQDIQELKEYIKTFSAIRGI